MESIMQIGMKRENYYEGTIIDIRKIFVGFGHWLEQKNIEDEGSIEDYENFLIEVDKQRELEREDDHLETLSWINRNKHPDFPFMLVKGDEYDSFMQSDDEDCIMDRQIIEGDEFYIKFKKITGIDLMELDNFISMKYIDEAQNDIELVVRVDDNNKIFVIGV